MPVNDGGRVSQRRLAIRDLLLGSPGRKWRTKEIADICGVSPDTAFRDLSELSGSGQLMLISTGETANFLWELDPDFDPRLPALRLDYAQGAALYAAARLLSQQQHERNEAVRTALLELVGVMPAPLRQHMEATVRGFASEAATTGQSSPANAGGAGRDLTSIFTTLSRGWLEGRVVRLTYEPLGVARVFTCAFRPYLLEPSGIGYTIYFIGQSDPPGALRTYKLERVRHVELTEERFIVPEDFDGPARFRRSWRVMAGEGELIHVKLRFNQFVARRVRETRWHPSQVLTETADGLIWEGDIGDITEIRPWVRGWGADCEALEPQELRDELVQEARRLGRLYDAYDAAPHATSGDGPSGRGEQDGPDQTLLDDLFGKE